MGCLPLAQVSKQFENIVYIASWPDVKNSLPFLQQYAARCYKFCSILCVRGVEIASYRIHHSGEVNTKNMLETKIRNRVKERDPERKIRGL
jgi:hypothetical protein